VARLFIEVKWIGKTGTWKQIVKQIHDDIQSYITHPSCGTIIFVVIDEPALVAHARERQNA